MKTKFLVSALVLGSILPAACNAITGINGFEVDPKWSNAGGAPNGGAGGTTASSGMGGSGGGAGGEQQGCSTELTCPGETNACQTRSCLAGACQLTFEVDGKLVPGQAAGDCGRLECDGKGQVHRVVDVLDLPLDGLDCTQDVCDVDGMPSHAPAAKGSKCAQNSGQVCDAMGVCVQCNYDTDCSGGGLCKMGNCVSPQCTDGISNGNETDIDCGGSDCPACGTDFLCKSATDCISKVCIGLKCKAPTCTDGVANGDETDADCGGPTCSGDCADGKKCLVGNDCVSGVCMGGMCQVPSCMDGVKNGNETGPDCGSGCPGCAVGQACNVHKDCATEVCRNATCTAIVQIDAGTGHACALLGDGTMYCWGTNGGGQLGDGTTTPHPAPTLVPGLTNITQILTATHITNVQLNGNTCARTNDGKLYCWGRNANGQVGDGTAVDVLAPKVILPADVVQVAAARVHTCARLTSGGVQCWGNNGTGQLGNGTMSTSTTPLPPIAGLSAKWIAAGSQHTCAIQTTGELSCWGANADGQLGLGNTTSVLVPTLVPGSANIIAVDAGYGFTCSVDTGGVLRCVGNNLYGQLGLGNAMPQTSPQVVPGVTNAVGVSCGTYGTVGGHTCALQADGTLYCFGLNNQGQLGLGDVMDRQSPAKVNLPPVAEVAAGYQFTCARLVNGPVRCWGRNDFSQLGTGKSSSIVLSPIAVVFP